MERVCPVCNNLTEVLLPCELCNHVMSDQGRIEEFFDDYSLNMPIENNGIYCTHVFQCKKCGNVKNYSIKIVNA